MEKAFRINRIHNFLVQEQEAGFVFPGESHIMAQLIYVQQGSLHCVVEGRDFFLQPGEVALVGPNQWHMLYADVGSAARYMTVIFDAEGMKLKTLLNRKITASAPVRAVLEQMLREQLQMDAYSADMLDCQLSMALILLLREYPRGCTNALSGENEIIRQAQQYVCAHVREKMTVPSVAGQVDVSPSYLTALFHKHLHISPGEYIRRVKLQESKYMIREKQLNFTEIAAALEYSTVHHYSRQFKEKFGMTPSEYAKSVR